jgi:hypothetical protein
MLNKNKINQVRYFIYIFLRIVISIKKFFIIEQKDIIKNCVYIFYIHLSKMKIKDYLILFKILELFR